MKKKHAPDSEVIIWLQPQAYRVVRACFLYMRHHVIESGLQKAIKQALNKAEIHKKAKFRLRSRINKFCITPCPAGITKNEENL